MHQQGSSCKHCMCLGAANACCLSCSIACVYRVLYPLMAQCLPQIQFCLAPHSFCSTKYIALLHKSMSLIDHMGSTDHAVSLCCLW